jgi:2-polyprenyl-3-methyl-5-hydroxy-6-metoxy-1,4-benzoquinol methylase
MYDTFSNDYDRFVNWNNRLAGELPFIEAQLATVVSAAGRSVRVLDAACGTGMHAIALAQRGHTCAGADLSASMIDRARGNAAAAGVEIPFLAVGFGELANAFGGGFDAVLCLGNSLPHLLTPADLADALVDFAACLRPGGLLLIQNRNFDAVIASRQRWMEPQAHSESRGEGVGEWLFLRFYDFEPNGLIQFNIVTLRRLGNAAWEQSITSTRLRPLLHGELVSALEQAGFKQVTAYGGLNGSPFDAGASGNLVLAAHR